VTFRPRNAVALGACNLKTRILGEELSLLALLAPVGYSRMMHPDGEVAAAREAGTGFILSTISEARADTGVSLIGIRHSSLL